MAILPPAKKSGNIGGYARDWMSSIIVGASRRLALRLKMLPARRVTLRVIPTKYPLHYPARYKTCILSGQRHYDKSRFAWYNSAAMKRIAIIILLPAIAVTVGIAVAYAASGGHLRASRVIYDAGDTSSTLTFENDVSFDYAGYHFSAGSAEIEIVRPEADELETDLKKAHFSGGVRVTTSTGGIASAHTLTMRKSGANYELTGSITYTEGDLQVKANRVSFDKVGNTLRASGNVEAIYNSPRGVKGEDGRMHPLVFKGDGLIFNRTNGTIKNTGDARPSVVFDGFTFTAGGLEMTLTDEGLMELAAAEDITVEGQGIVVSGVNAEYKAQTGELRIWGDVKYTRDSDEFSAEDVIWYISEDNNRINVIGGSGTIGVGQEEELETEFD